jgi:hypothetical protein
MNQAFGAIASWLDTGVSGGRFVLVDSGRQESVSEPSCLAKTPMLKFIEGGFSEDCSGLTDGGIGVVLGSAAFIVVDVFELDVGAVSAIAPTIVVLFDGAHIGFAAH